MDKQWQEAIAGLRARLQLLNAFEPVPDVREAAAFLGGGDFPPPPPFASAAATVLQVPALKHLTIPVLQQLRGILRIRGPVDDVMAWARTLLHVCEIRQRELKQRLATDGITAQQCEVKLFLLSIFFLECFERSGDARFVNVALKMLDQPWAPDVHRANRALRHEESAQASALAIAAHILAAKAVGDLAGPYRSSIAAAEVVSEPPREVRPLTRANKHVVVFSPNRFSLYTLIVVAMLRNAGVIVDAIAVRRLTSPTRLITEFRFEGRRLLKKIWDKLILRRHAYPPADFAQVPDQLDALDVRERTIEALAKRHHIQIVDCEALNDASVHQMLESRRPDLVVFTGGGILRNETLARSGAGVLNCHMGQLPAYRGVDVVEWPVLEKHAEALGFTVHLMDEGIDTGDVLNVVQMRTSNTASFAELRRKFELQMAIALVDTAVGLLNGEIHPRPQPQNAGRQYYMMHPRLHDIARRQFAGLNV